jgi:hypothetical protein
MAKKIKKNLNAEKLVKALYIEPLDEHDILAASKRVWNSIEYTIHYDQPKVQEIKPFKSKRVFWSPFFKFATAFSLILIFGVGIIYYDQNIVKNTNESQRQANANNEVVKEDNVRKLAASRFTELNGVSFEEYKEAVIATETPAPQVFENEANTSGIPASVLNYSDANLQKVDETKVEELAKKSEQSRPDIYYSQSEIQFTKDFTSEMPLSFVFFGQGMHPKIDYSKPLNYESWLTANYSKTLLNQSNNPIAENIVTPEYSLSYAGGKYAVEIVNSKYSYSVAGLAANGSEVVNPEIQLLKHILKSTSLDQAKLDSDGSIVIESREVFTPILLPLDGKQTDLLTKYYLNKDTFHLSKTEFYFKDKLILTIKEIKSEEIKKDPKEIITNIDIKGKLEVKTLKHEDILQRNSNGDNLIKPFNDRYTVLYFKDQEYKDIKVFDYNPKYYNFFKTLDFNPLYKDENSKINKVANYAFAKAKLNVDVYDKEPDFSLNTSEKPIQTSGKVKIDDDEIEATFFTKADNKTKEVKNIEGVKVLYKGLWYIFTATESGNSYFKDYEGNTILELSEINAKSIDAANEAAAKKVEPTSKKDASETLTPIPSLSNKPNQ